MTIDFELQSFVGKLFKSGDIFFLVLKVVSVNTGVCEVAMLFYNGKSTSLIVRKWLKDQFLSTITHVYKMLGAKMVVQC